MEGLLTAAWGQAGSEAVHGAPPSHTAAPRAPGASSSWARLCSPHGSAVRVNRTSYDQGGCDCGGCMESSGSLSSRGEPESRSWLCPGTAAPGLEGRVGHVHNGRAPRQHRHADRSAALMTGLNGCPPPSRITTVSHLFFYMFLNEE